MLQLFLSCLLILWTQLLTIPVLSFCPARCKCNEVKLLVFCNNTQIDLVPIMLNPQLKELYLSQNRVKDVYSSFTVYQDLKYLDISYNLISDIGIKSFIMQKKLRVLLLYGNNITQINNLSFHGLNSLHLLNLNQNQLHELHNRVFMGLNKLETLDLSFNQISFINKEAFFGLLNLKKLNLHGNKIKQIPTQSFFYLQSLVKLNLGRNLFSHIPELSFSPLTLLRELSIDSCYINQISFRAFSHLKNLKYLDLQNNKVENVPSKSLGELSSLKVLMLSGNLIGTLPSNSFPNLTNLQTLIISFSPLSYIERDAFRDNANLNRIIIENNPNLQSLSEGTFIAQSSSLTHLSLRANRISWLDQGTLNLAIIQYLDLQENPLACNCSINWLIQYLQMSNLSQSQREQVKCYTPASLQGIRLITLSETDLSCPKFDSSVETILNVVTCATLAILIVLVVVICRRHKPSCLCAGSSRDGSGVSISSSISTEHSVHHHHQQHHQNQQHQPQSPYQSHQSHHHRHMIASMQVSKSRLDHSLYYPPIIINEEFARHKHYQTMTTSTRTSALSVDLHPGPLHYVPISAI